MTKFEITYTDPVTEQRKTVECQFHYTPPGVYNGMAYGAISATKWAEDYAYALGDKRGDYVIKPLYHNRRDSL
jgi:hypothetical protein